MCSSDLFPSHDRCGHGNSYGYDNGYGHGNGHGHGYGYGNGHGHGYGDGHGHGYGDGHGHGNGDGYGYGDGDGHGHGYGDGHGHGNGDGYGYGDGNSGIKSINGDKVYNIDGVNTIIKTIKGNIAKGFILRNDLTLVPCYIVKNDYFFAHGDTIKAALKSLQEKTDLNLPIPQRIINFKNQFHDFNVKIKAQVLYDWHFKLTGSCKMGRDTFCINNNINIEKDKFTVNEFIALTKDSYKGEIIKLLKS